MKHEFVGYHVDYADALVELCWGRCSNCADGWQRFETEAVAEEVAAILRRRYVCDTPARRRKHEQRN